MTYAGLEIAESVNESHLGGNVIEGDPFTFAPSAWRYLLERFAIKSVLDLGSGRGYAANFFHTLGAQVIAVDGFKENCESAIFPTVHIDLTKSVVHTRVDLVHCQEVVEHIEEKFIDNLISSLTCGRLIVMTNALPGQGGHHHVNEQPTEYWIEKFHRYNCEVLIEDSNRVRKLAANDGAIYLAKTALVLTNKNFINN